MKKIFIMRHGQAETLAAQDNLRKLTGHGREEVEKMAMQLASKEAIDVVISSPYLRAVETAEIMSTHVKPQLREQYADFVPEAHAQSAVEFIQALVATKPEFDTWLFVAHMPIVSYMVDAFCPDNMPIFATAAVCELAYDEKSGKAGVVGMTLPHSLGYAY